MFPLSALLHPFEYLVSRSYAPFMALLSDHVNGQQHQYDLLLKRGSFAHLDIETRRRIWNVWKDLYKNQIRFEKNFNFAGAKLSAFNLSHCIFSHTTMADADFISANLRHAHLENCHLEEASFAFADLRDAHLEGAHLEKADFSEADMRNTHLKGAVLIDADLERAIAADADFSEADLRGVDLEKVEIMNAIFIKVKNCSLTPQQLQERGAIVEIPTTS